MDGIRSEQVDASSSVCPDGIVGIRMNRGKTTVLMAEEARELLGSIDITTVVGLRDRALISLMAFSFARISAVTAMRVEDYYPEGKRWWVRLHEKATVLTVKRRFAFR
ncbi:MAG: hypothetical protein ACLPKW_29455 [Acetobacteraceae bacterium]